MPTSWAGAATRYETWQAMEDLYLDKRVRVIGVSNFSLRQLRGIVEHKEVRVRPQVLQMEFHPCHQSKEIVDYCAAQGIAVQAYASLGGTEKISKDASVSLIHDPVIKGIANEVERSPSAVLLRWALQRGVCIIPKSSRNERVRDNTQIFDFSLTETMMGTIDAMTQTGRWTWKGEDFDAEP